MKYFCTKKHRIDDFECERDYYLTKGNELVNQMMKLSQSRKKERKMEVKKMKSLKGICEKLEKMESVDKNSLEFLDRNKQFFE